MICKMRSEPLGKCPDVQKAAGNKYIKKKLPSGRGSSKLENLNKQRKSADSD
jgi:hypothetical protein